MSTFLAYLTVITVTVVLGGLLYLLRSDIKEHMAKKAEEELEGKLDEAVKKHHSLTSAVSIARRARRLRK